MRAALTHQLQSRWADARHSLLQVAELYWWKDNPLGRFLLLAIVLVSALVIGYLASGYQLYILDLPRFLGILALGFLLPVFLKDASWALMALIFIFPFIFLSEVTFFGVTLFNVVGALLVGAWLSHVLLFRKPIVYERAMWLLVIAFAIMVASSAYAGLTDPVIRTLFRLFQLFVLFFLVVQIVDSEKALRRVGWAFILSTSLSALLSILAFIFAWDLRPGPGDLFTSRLAGGGLVTQFHGVVGGTSATGLQMVLASIFVFQYLTLYKEPIIRYLLLILLPILLGALLITVNLTSLLIFLIVIPLVWRGGSVSFTEVILRWGIVGLVLFVALYFAFDSFRVRLDAQVDRIQNANPAKWGSERGELWIAGYKTAMEKPLLGVGAGNAYTDMLKYVDPELVRRRFSNLQPGERALDPHNSYLGIAANYGWPTLGILLIFFTATIRKFYRALKKVPRDHPSSVLGKIILLLLLATFLASMAGDIHENMQLWLFLGLAVAFVRIAQRQQALLPHR
ncbi:MAG: O-antigen ligase family protein [Dehalococcoidia bacterium]